MIKTETESSEYFWKHGLLYPYLAPDLSNIFTKDGNTIDPIQLSYIRFHSLPQLLVEKNIDCINALNWFEIEYKTECTDSWHNWITTPNDKLNEKRNLIYAYYLLAPFLLVHFDVKRRNVFFLAYKARIKKAKEINQKIAQLFKIDIDRINL